MKNQSGTSCTNRITCQWDRVMFEKEAEFNCIVSVTKNIIANFIGRFGVFYPIFYLYPLYTLFGV
jgi:hypothetical protein